MFSFTIEGVPFCIFVSNHANLRMKQRKVQKYAAFGSIVALGEELLDMKHGEEFCVIDQDVGISVVCALYCRSLEVYIEIITVLDNSRFYAKKGTKVYKIN